MNWKKVFLGSLYELPSRNGLTRPSKVRGVGYKMINMGELFANEWLYDIPMERVQLNDREKRECLIAKNDLLFARQSLVASGAGKCSIVREVKEPTTFESHLIRVRLDTTKAVPLFYYYYFKSPLSPMKTIVTICAQAGIRGSDLATLSVECPDLPTQRRIASILSAYDDLIENNRRQIKLLEEAAQRLYREWFVELRFPGHESVKVVDGVPEGWKKGTFDDICIVKKDALTPDKISPGMPYIGLEHIPRNDFCLADWGMSEEVNSNKFRFNAGDILFGKIRPYFHKVGFTICNGICSTDSIVMNANDEYYCLLLMTASSDEFVDYTYQTCKEGAKMPRADWNTMKMYPVLIPDSVLLRRFNKQISAIKINVQFLLCKIDSLLKLVTDFCLN